MSTGLLLRPRILECTIRSLLNLEYTRHTKAIAFADDLILAIKGTTRSEIENFANIELAKITKWAMDNKIQFNEDKSKVMLISRRKRREEKTIKIYMKNKLLAQVNIMKYLGILLDSKFKFREHIKHTAERCTKLIHMLSKSAKLNWGLNHGALKTIYKGAIVPLLLYGAPVWITAMKYAYNRKLYLRVQRLINIKMAKAYRTVSHEALCTLTGMIPITIKAEEVATYYNSTRGSRKLAQLDYETESKDWPHPADFVRILEEGNEDTDFRVQIFTDGSKSEHGVGAGIATFVENHPTNQQKFKLDSKCSNNQAEQYAILKALEAIERDTENTIINERTAIIYTDSKITIDSLQNTRNHNNLINKIRHQVKHLENSKWRINFSWVKAHAGTFGNELADKLAKDAAREPEATISYNKIPKSNIEMELKEAGIQKWQQEWEKTNKGAITKLFFPSIEQRLKMKLNLTPNLTAIITGHGLTRSYLHRFNITDNPTCPCNNEAQTIDHLIYQCPLVEKERNILRNQVIKAGCWPPNKEDFIKKHFKQFIQFANSIDFKKL